MAKATARKSGCDGRGDGDGDDGCLICCCCSCLRRAEIAEMPVQSI